jgi:hypothetical protein
VRRTRLQDLGLGTAAWDQQCAAAAAERRPPGPNVSTRARFFAVFIFVYGFLVRGSNDGWDVIADCSRRSCAYARAWADRAHADDEAHSLVIKPRPTHSLSAPMWPPCMLPSHQCDMLLFFNGRCASNAHLVPGRGPHALVAVLGGVLRGGPVRLRHRTVRVLRRLLRQRVPAHQLPQRLQ